MKGRPVNAECLILSPIFASILELCYRIKNFLCVCVAALLNRKITVSNYSFLAVINDRLNRLAIVEKHYYSIKFPHGLTLLSEHCNKKVEVTKI